MILSDRDIKREVKNRHILITPYDPKSVQPASYDLRLGSEFQIFRNFTKAYLDVKEPIEDYMELVKIKDGGYLVIHPGEFILGTTIEKVKIPTDMIARLDGKSSLGRIGIIVHATAGYIDPGFNGFLTLEITNLGNIPIAMYPGMKVGQISFMRLESPAEVSYGKKRGSKYQGQKGPTVSKLWKDYKGKKAK